MKPEDVLAIAQQGNPKVIAAIINRTTEPYGIFVRVARRGSCLYVLLEGDIAEQQDVLVSFIQTSLRKLKVYPINSAIIYGRLKGQISMAWSEYIKIPHAAVPSSPQSKAIPPFSPSPDLSHPLGDRHPIALEEEQASASPLDAESPVGNPSPITIDALLRHLVAGADGALPKTPLEEEAIAEVNAIDLEQGAKSLLRSQAKGPSQTQPAVHLNERAGYSGGDRPNSAPSLETSTLVFTDASPIPATSHEEEIDLVELDLAAIGLADDISSVVSELNALQDIINLEQANNIHGSNSPEPTDPSHSHRDISVVETIPSNREDSTPPEDVIPSEQGQIETLSLTLSPSNWDGFEQEDLQVGNNQQTVSTLDNCEASQEKTVTPAEALAQSWVSDYAPDSITAKFNTLVGPSDTNAEGQTLIQDEPTQEAPATISESEVVSEAMIPPDVAATTPESGSELDAKTVLNGEMASPLEESPESPLEKTSTPDVPAIAVSDSKADLEILNSETDSASAIADVENANGLHESSSVAAMPPTEESTDSSLVEEAVGEGQQEADLDLELSPQSDVSLGEPLRIPTAKPVSTAPSQTVNEGSHVDPTDQQDPDMSDEGDDKQPEKLESNTGPDLDKVDLDAFIRYPEALVLIFFTIAFFIWQTYISILDEAAPEGTLTASKLAKRLGVNPSTISRRKEKPGFEEWSQSIDPDGLAWSYTDGFFVPHLV